MPPSSVTTRGRLSQLRCVQERSPNSPPTLSSSTAARGHQAPDTPVRRHTSSTIAPASTPVSRPDGAYWARSQRDPAHAGVTVHLVDEGVDTGDVLYQATTEFSFADNIATYQHRQMATALPLLIRAIEEALAGRLSPRRVNLPLPAMVPPDTLELCSHRRAERRVVAIFGRSLAPCGARSRRPTGAGSPARRAPAGPPSRTRSRRCRLPNPR